ncbi:MAG TPA: dirigent protein [Gaiellaceae bacterium]
MTIRSALAAAAAAAGCATAVTAAVSASGATGPAQIRITDEAVSRSVAPPPNGGVAGTTEVIAQRLFNRHISNRAIGRSQIVCTYVDRRNRSCLSTYVLPKGSLVAAGAVSTRLLYDLPVVGGTGLYDNARGTVTVTATHVRPRREVLVFRLVG